MFYDYSMNGLDENEIRDWATDNGISICWVGVKGQYSIIGFFNKTDAMAFKLRWM